MLVINKTAGTIILPSRHRLRPGENDLPEHSLFGRKNKTFALQLLRKDRIALAQDGPSSQQAPIEVDDGPLTRLKLATKRREWVIEAGVTAGLLRTELEAIKDTDMLRVEVAERLFE